MSQEPPPHRVALETDSFLERVARATVGADLDRSGDVWAPVREPTGPEGYVQRASVLVPLFKGESGPGVLLIKRSDRVRLHRGEISFPGGAVDASDRSPLDTALRETEEEIGLGRKDIEVMGRLPVGVTVVSSYLVVPYVGVIPNDRARVTPQPSEVADVLWLSISEFLDRDSLRIEHRTFEGFEVPLYFFHLSSGEIVWGLTARILYDLLARTGLLGE